MLSETGKLYRHHVWHWVIALAAWLILFIVAPVLPGQWPHFWGLALGVIGAPVAVWYLLRKSVGTWGLIVAAGLPLVVTLTFKLTYLIPDERSISWHTWFSIGIGVGIVAALLTPTDTIVKSSRILRPLVICFTGTAWAAIALAGCCVLTLRPASHTQTTICLAHLYAVGCARTAYEKDHGHPPSSISLLVQSGFLSERESKCPLGTPYCEVSALAKSGEPHHYVVLCTSHSPRILALDESRSVYILAPTRSWIYFKFGPEPW